MVATKLSEVAGKGWEWYSGAPPPGADPGSVPSTPSSNSMPSSAQRVPAIALAETTASSQAPPSALSVSASDGSSSSGSATTYWEQAQHSIQQAAENTYSKVAGVVSSVVYQNSSDAKSNIDATSGNPSLDLELEDFYTITRKSNTNSVNSILMSPSLLKRYFQNPSVIVRGGRRSKAHPPSSMEAVRSLLSVVPPELTSPSASSLASPFYEQSSIETQPEHQSQPDEGATTWKSFSWLATDTPQTSFDSFYSKKSSVTNNMNSTTGFTYSSSASETASQLAEGTLRAMRDIALDEAVELHAALRHWSYRWERPLLSWLEAGPEVWFSEDGYQHNRVGQKVSQIQAVLARRCSAIGDLQQHLLRAGWQRGVGQWGFLGDGGEWAPVAGSDGRMPSEDLRSTPRSFRRVPSEGIDDIPPPPMHQEKLPSRAPLSNVSKLPDRSRDSNNLYYTNISVKNSHGGRIELDDPALAEWSVDAMAIVRHQLYRAANGMVELPHTTNWSRNNDDGNTNFGLGLPHWAKRSHLPKVVNDESEEHIQGFDDAAAKIPNNGDEQQQERVIISDLPLMIAEVSGLLDVMESIMGLQRARRLEKLKPPNFLRQNWYIGAIVIPPISYLLIRVTTKGSGWSFLKYTAQKFVDFFREHVVDPCFAMYNEFTRGIENVSDREARNIAIVNLQKMIRSWLDETYPDMPVQERQRRATAMDISLIEAQKEESMKTIYELNSVIRMSFIEAQFIKKEMMNALLALDEMRSSTNFNLNIAAVTPFILLVYTAKRTFQFVFYAMLKMGKSREETYASFLHILTEIERLLVMRDNPPIRKNKNHNEDTMRAIAMASEASGGVENQLVVDGSPDSVLIADDLGMLMLHIHELRTILWTDRRRFSSDVLRSVAEDLAELAGERGAVSVRQQLQIIERMCRTYPFLKVISSRVIFEYVQS